MKYKIILIVATALVTFGLRVDAFAFHNGGVGACEGCHTMHNSMNSSVMTRNSLSYLPNPPTLAIGQAGPFLLQASDQSSTCLNCHATRAAVPTQHAVFSFGNTGPTSGAPTQRTPGGDFGWLRKTSRVGHNIIARDYGLLAETQMAGNVAPGGTYPVERLHCTSCHDPHGKTRKLSDDTFANSGAPIQSSGSYGQDAVSGMAVGAYRLLGGKGYLPASVSDDPTLAFTEDPIVAASPENYNDSDVVKGKGSGRVIVTYGGSTVGSWCRQCHLKMHENGTAVNVHPNDEAVGNAIAGIYNAYLGSDGKGSIRGYTSLIPVAYDNFTKNSLLRDHFTDGAIISTTDRIMCLSCHRAHASGFVSITRFPMADVFTSVQGGVASYQTGADPTQSAISYLTPAEMQAALYDRPASEFGVEARALCNKCHLKD